MIGFDDLKQYGLKEIILFWIVLWMNFDNVARATYPLGIYDIGP